MPDGGAPPDIQVTELAPADVPAAGALLGRAYRDNPLTIALFGNDADLRERINGVAFAMRVKAMKPPALAVKDGGRLVGVCGFDPPGGTPIPSEDRRAMMVAWSEVGPDVGPTLMRMLQEWGRRAPREPHWNLGPVGVAADMQGKGMAKAMLQRFCEMMDAEKAIAFLETDLAVNARLYEKFGFVTTESAVVEGIETWFMVREPRP